jgi:hypothetical protein
MKNPIDWLEFLQWILLGSCFVLFRMQDKNMDFVLAMLHDIVTENRTRDAQMQRLCESFIDLHRTYEKLIAEAEAARDRPEEVIQEPEKCQQSHL